ncbi:hypothetical protein KUTeg_024837 [Tegillarca granosa]|uniref:FCS-type domain-containing protein n=1 Tax=Tegillarca granosa TaxID=220873 RepID=A0ABQ9E1K0_TEGGR|nr:hypothetical protein KUTeg_024837 [Tegillarca granosa]
MDQSDTDWGGWNMSEQVDMDTVTDNYHKKEDSNLSMADAKSDSVYDSSNMGGEDDYMNNLNFYDGYDSYNEMSGNSSDDDDENERPPNFAFSYQQTNQSTPFRFINGKEGMATCERCGAVGIKHAFYSKSKRFCSLSCSRSFATAQREGKPLQKEPIIPQRKAPGKKITSPGKHHQTPKSQALPKTLSSRPGYKVLLRYEGFAEDPTQDFWLNLCTQDVHPVGWCATIGKPLVPPRAIQHKYSDWKEYLVKRLTGARTLPSNFYNKLKEPLANGLRFQVGMKLEAIDPLNLSAICVATVTKLNKYFLTGA